MRVYDVVFYHGPCPDGEAAAFLLKDHGRKFVPYTHGKTKIDVEQLKDKDVLFVDMCPTEPILRAVKDTAKSVFVVDHHPVLDVCKAVLAKDAYVIDTSGLACASVMVWNLLFKPEVEKPYWLYVVNLQDTGKFAQMSDIDKAFHLAFHDIKASERPYTLDEHHHDWLVNKGKLIVKGQQMMHERQLRVQSALKMRYRNTITFGGRELKVAYAVVASPTDIALTAELLLVFEADADFAAICQVHTGHCNFSLRRRTTDTINLQAIAKSIGGGGHEAASAVQLQLTPEARAQMATLKTDMWGGRFVPAWRIHLAHMTAVITLFAVIFLAWYFETIDTFPCDLSLMAIRGPARFAFLIGLVLLAVQLGDLHWFIDIRQVALIPLWLLRLVPPRFRVSELMRLPAWLGLLGSCMMVTLVIFHSMHPVTFVVHVVSALVCFAAYVVYVCLCELPPRWLWLQKKPKLIIGLFLTRFLLVASYKAFVGYKFLSTPPNTFWQWTDLIIRAHQDPSMRILIQIQGPLQWALILILMSAIIDHFHYVNRQLAPCLPVHKDAERKEPDRKAVENKAVDRKDA